MATEVYTSEEIKLLNGVEVLLTPLPVAKMRKFMDRWGDWADIINTSLTGPEEERLSEREFSGKQYDAYIDLCEIALPDMKVIGKDGKTMKDLSGEDQDFKDYLENILDDATILKVLEICGGLKLNDPNLQKMVLEQMAAQQAQDGKS